MTPPPLVPTPIAKIGIPLAFTRSSDFSTSPLHDWPSEISTNALAFGDLPWISSSLSISLSPQ